MLTQEQTDASALLRRMGFHIVYLPTLNHFLVRGERLSVTWTPEELVRYARSEVRLTRILNRIGNDSGM